MFGLFDKKYKNTITIKIEGMMCSHCEAHVIDAIKKVNNVQNVTASHTKKVAVVSSNEDVDIDEIKKAIKDTGYEVVDII